MKASATKEKRKMEETEERRYSSLRRLRSDLTGSCETTGIKRRMVESSQQNTSSGGAD